MLSPHNNAENAGPIELPQSLESEEQVLGAVLLDGYCLDQLVDVIHPRHFFHRKNQLVFQAMAAIRREGLSVDMVSTMERLRADGNFDAVGGVQYLTGLLDKVATTANAKTHAHTVVNRALQRSILGFAKDLQVDARDKDPHELLRKGIAELNQLSGGPGSPGDSRFIESSLPARILYEMEIDPPKALVGRLVTEGSFSLFYGRPGLGKTWASFQLALALAKGGKWFGFQCQQCKVGIIELEMHTYYIKERLHAICKTPEDIKALENIEILARPEFKGTMDILNENTRQGIVAWCKKNNIEFLMIDAMQRIHHEDENTSQGLGKVLAAMDMLREEAEVALWLIHHENKGGDTRGKSDRETNLDAARGSSRLQSDPQTLLRLHDRRKCLVLSCAKTNLGSEPEDVWLKRNDDGTLSVAEAPTNPNEVRVRNEAKIEEFLVNAGPDGVKREELEEATGLGRSALYKYLKRLGAEKGADGLYRSKDFVESGKPEVLFDDEE